MRTIIYLLFFGMILIFSCESKDSSECDPFPCRRPRVNQASLTLDLEHLNHQDLSLIQVIRINKDDNSVIDTVNFEMSQALKKQITFGDRGIIDYSEPRATKDKEGNLNFRILINGSSDSYDISNIEFEYENADKCECLEYQIKTLQLDNTTITINSSNYILALK